jgi:hypothetical protein
VVNIATDYEKCIEVFESEIRERYEIPPDLLKRWFDTARAEYSIDIKNLEYDDVLGMFKESNDIIPVVLGLMIVKQYIKRELSRINRLNNIIGKDLQLNATQFTKTAVKAEYDSLLGEINEKLHKLKIHAYS